MVDPITTIAIALAVIVALAMLREIVVTLKRILFTLEQQRNGDAPARDAEADRPS